MLEEGIQGPHVLFLPPKLGKVRHGLENLGDHNVILGLLWEGRGVQDPILCGLHNDGADKPQEQDIDPKNLLIKIKNENEKKIKGWWQQSRGISFPKNRGFNICQGFFG